MPFLRREESPEMVILLERVYRKSYRRLILDFVAKVNRGDITAAPTILGSNQDAIKTVETNPRAFTVVLAKKLPKKPNKRIRVLRLDNKKPGEPGYPLFAKSKQMSAATGP